MYQMNYYFKTVFLAGLLCLGYFLGSRDDVTPALSRQLRGLYYLQDRSLQTF